MSILLSNGDGTFKNAIDTGLDWYINLSSICASDFDGDGNSDLAVTSSTNGKVMILLGKGDGRFDTGKPIPAYNVGDNPLWLTASDFDLDGDIDLAVANDDSNNISTLLNEGDGTFKKGSTYDFSYPARSPENIYSSDLNGDGYTDLPLLNWSSIPVMIDRSGKKKKRFTSNNFHFITSIPEIMNIIEETVTQR